MIHFILVVYYSKKVYFPFSIELLCRPSLSKTIQFIFWSLWFILSNHLYSMLWNKSCHIICNNCIKWNNMKLAIFKYQIFKIFLYEEFFILHFCNKVSAPSPPKSFFEFTSFRHLKKVRICLLTKRKRGQSGWSFHYTKVSAAWKLSAFGVFLVRIFPHSDWIWRDMKYLSIFNPNAGKYGPGKLRIRTIFT